MKRIGFVALGCIAFFGLGVYAMAQMMSGHSGHHMNHGGNGQHQHDEVNMPMLNGKNTTQDEVAHMRTLFQQHPSITRDVKNIENGIVTTTLSDDPKVADALINHVAEMITRVEQGDNPEVPIQSPTLSILFEQGDSIETEIEIVENGVIVTQTSDNSDVVAALRKHAGEVSDLAKRGMVAVHEQMMKAHHGG